ncbi:tetratricopeptide repeat protein [Streptacidiphilus sp. EB129]|uniref:tetratricopeptide repeat protein n=1 Tax=Streptacidiphilus sp. EB129 TaxID=3156262 RepID=UPI0035118934
MSGNDARASGHSRVYQASGDQHITEHHHHGPSWSGPDSVRRPSIGRGPLILRDRVEVMAQLREALASGGGTTFVLHGLGGCGKTAVAFALFRHAVEVAGRVALWVNASDTASLRAGMLAVAADRGANEGELGAARSGLRAAADLVWAYLDASDQPWLLVLDNADDPDVLRDGGWLRSSARGTVLVTSRQAAARWWPGAELLHVGVLPLPEAARVLCDLAPEAGTVEDAEEIAERLGRLPLALTLAGGFLAQQVISPWTMGEYGEHLTEERGLDRIALIDQGADTTQGDQSRQLLSRTWQLSLDALAGRGLPEAVDLLRLLAYWAGDPLPLAVLRDAGTALAIPQPRVELALRGLLDQSLTQLTDDGSRCLRTHGVLLDSVASGTPEAERDRFAAAAARLLVSRVPEIPQRGQADPETTLLVPHARALLRRAAGRPGVTGATVQAAAESCLRLVIALHRGSDRTSALALAGYALELTHPALGADHPVVLRLRRRIGRSLHRLGRFDEAVVCLRAALADAERALGPDSPEALDTALALAITLNQQERTAEEAAELFGRVVGGRTTALGSGHPLTLLARAHGFESPLAIHLEAALPGAAQLKADCLRELGPDHQITLAVELDIAYALHTTGRSQQALPEVRRVIEAHERHYGADHPMTLSARYLFAEVLAATGHPDEALQQAEALCRGRETVLGPDHPWTALAHEFVAALRTT